LSRAALAARSRWADAPVADGLVVGVLVALVCIPVWPGVFNSDSQFMLLAARNNTVSNYYAPLHGWVWGVLDRAGVPPALVFLLSVAAFVTAVLILVKQFLPDPAARCTAAAIVVFPPVYGLLGLVGRDVWFATAAVAITAGAWHVLRTPRMPSLRLSAVLIVFAGVAADSRQNGAPFAALAVGLVAYRLIRHIQPRISPVMRFGAATAAVAVFFGGILLAQRFVVTQHLYPEQNLYVGDLVGVTLVRDEPVLDRSLFPSQDVDLLRSRVGPLDLGAVVYADPPIVTHRNDSSQINSLWATQWRDMLRSHPVDYLIWRTKLYLAQLGVTHGVRYPYFEGSAELHNGLGPSVDNVFPEALDVRNSVLSAFDGPMGTGSFLVVPVWYLLVAIGSLVVLARQGDGRSAMALLLVVLTMQGLLFFTAPGSEYRLEYFQVVLGTTFGSIVLARQVESVTVRGRRRHARPMPPAATHL
jgi:hypothetical protein